MSITPRPPGTHRCPGGCGANIPDRMLSCRPHWYALPVALRSRVQMTAGKSLLDPERMDVIAAVMEFYAERSPDTPREWTPPETRRTRD